MDLLQTLIRAGFLAFLALASSACTSFPPGTPLPDILHEINATLQPNEVLFQPGDKVVVEFLTESQHNQQTGIRPDGNAVFKFIGEVEMAGLSVDQAQDLLTRLYDREIVGGALLVRAGNLGKRKIHFMGDVKGKASLEIGPGMTIDMIEALSDVGAPKDTFTLLEHTVLIRWMPQEERRRHWVIDVRAQYWATEELLLLQGGDIIYIPTHPIRITTQWMRELVKLIPLPYINYVGN